MVRICSLTLSTKLCASERDVKAELTLILYWLNTVIRFEAVASICFLLLSLEIRHPLLQVRALIQMDVFLI